MLLVWCSDGRLPSDMLSLCDRLADSLPGPAGAAPSGPGDSEHIGAAEAGRRSSTSDSQVLLGGRCSLSGEHPR